MLEGFVSLLVMTGLKGRDGMFHGEEEFVEFLVRGTEIDQNFEGTHGFIIVALFEVVLGYYVQGFGILGILGQPAVRLSELRFFILFAII